MKKDNTYQSINQRINQSVKHYHVPFQVGKEAALNSLLNRIKEDPQQQNRIYTLPVWIQRTAAVAAIVIVVFISGMLITTRQVRNEGTQVAVLRLPDDSRVVLSEKSSVKFNRLFLNRKVNLKGKAYFEVMKGSKFRVNTSKGNVEVLGTRFMVDEKSDRMQVICFEGKVKATYKDKKVILIAGSGISFSPDQKQVQMNETMEYPPMAMFSMDYNNASLDVVLDDLESFFDVKIDSNIRQHRYFSGTLHTGNLETALSIVTVSMKLKYKIQSDRSVIIYK
jgi:transmembrane sensor